MTFDNEIQMGQYIVHMIDEGHLINSDTVQSKYGFSLETLEGLVRSGQLPPPSQYFGKEWHLKEVIEMLHEYYGDDDE